ncbi:hypothetical protein [Streptomyces sp. NPDC089919]|uniref:hypothetical protein n=1 Tax=Streptomyces sp. NPDC089919 TaxID=3155188 RepID=UPI00342D5276
MTASVNVRRLVAEASVLGSAAAASATPASVAAAVRGDPATGTSGGTATSGAAGRRASGQRARKWVKGYWAPGQLHEGYRDHHGKWHNVWWGKGYGKQRWVPDHYVSRWNCHGKW